MVPGAAEVMKPLRPPFSQKRGSVGGVVHGWEVPAVHIPVGVGLVGGGRGAGVPVVNVAGHEQRQLQYLRRARSTVQSNA